MAADESSLEKFNDDVLVSDIVKIQALLRGQMVRKQMKEIQQLYEEIVHDIDGPDMEVVWSHNFLSRPVVRKVKKVESKVMNQNVIKDNRNWSGGPIGGQFHSFRSEKTSIPMATSAHVNANTNATDTLLEKPNVMSTEVQTEALPDNEVQFIHVPDIYHNCQHRHVQECECASDMSTKQPQLKSTKVFHSEIHRNDINLSSSYVHKSWPLTQDRAQISDDVDKGQIRSHFSSGETDRSSQRRTSGDRISASEGVLLMEKVACETHHNSRDQERQEPEKLFHETVYNDKSSELIESTKLIHESVNSDRKLEKLEPEKLAHESAGNSNNVEEPERDFSVETDKAKIRPQKDKGDVRRTTEIMPGFAEVVDMPNDRNQLLQLKHTMAMELLWVQQAINSRKHYLRVREQMK